MWHFYFPFPYCIPCTMALLKMAVHVTTLWPWYLIPEKAEQTFFSKNCVYLFFTLYENYLKYEWKALVFFLPNSLKAEKQWHSSKTMWGKEIINSCLGQKIKIIAKKQNAEILDRKARMRLSLGNFAIQKCLYLLGNLERNAHA